MKLSEQLKQDHDCGDFGEALDGRWQAALKIEHDLIQAEDSCERYKHVLEYVLRRIPRGMVSTTRAYVEEITKP